MIETPGLNLSTLQSWLPARPREAHKGLFGHVLVVGGDYGMPGAVRLAAEGALRVGAGLVSVVTRKAHLTSTVSTRPELLCFGFGTFSSGLDALIERCHVIVIGPGLGQSRWSKRLLKRILAHNKPTVLDADALNLLSQQCRATHRDNWILTPHPGEAARLLNQSIAEVQSNRIHAIKSLQQQYGGVIVLKGAHTLIANETTVTSCCAGNPGMASAGMGDLLSGLITGLIAQHLPLWQAAQAGVLIHATAGDRAASLHGERGLLASDLLQEIPRLVNQYSMRVV